MAGRIDNGRVGVAIGIEIRPGKCLDTRYAREGLYYRESVVAIVSQNLRDTIFLAKNHV